MRFHNAAFHTSDLMITKYNTVKSAVSLPWPSSWSSMSRRVTRRLILDHDAGPEHAMFFYSDTQHHNYTCMVTYVLYSVGLSK